MRDLVNPKAGIIIVHHTKKLNKRQLIEEPFQSFSGAGSLRGYYSTGMLLYRQDEHLNARTLTMELRNGPAIPDKLIDKKRGRWVELEYESQRLVNQNHGEKLDAERRRKHDVILQLIFDEAVQGRVYTIAQFAEAFEGRAGLGADRTIQNRIGVLATKGYVKFFKDSDCYGKPSVARSKYGYMCVERMELKTEKLETDFETGEQTNVCKPVLPSHYKCPQTGAALPVENPHIWIYQEEKIEQE